MHACTQAPPTYLPLHACMHTHMRTQTRARTHSCTHEHLSCGNMHTHHLNIPILVILKELFLLILCAFHTIHPNPTQLLAPPYLPFVLTTSPPKEKKQNNKTKKQDNKSQKETSRCEGYSVSVCPTVYTLPSIHLYLKTFFAMSHQSEHFSHVVQPHSGWLALPTSSTLALHAPTLSLTLQFLSP